MNNKVVKKISSILIVIIMCMTPLALTGSAFAAVNIQDLNHQINIPTNKTWTIKLSNKLHTNLINNLSTYVKVFSPNGGELKVGLSYNATNKAIKITPPSGGYSTSTTYSIIVKSGLYDSEGKYIESPAVKEFSTVPSNHNVSTLGTMSTYSVGTTVDNFANIQYNKKPPIFRALYSGDARKTDIAQYLEPSRYKNDKNGIYMFMKLNFIQDISVSTLNSVLVGKGKLSNMGQAFYDACKTNNVNQAYAVAHALLETGNGTSALAKGVDYKKEDGTTVKVYNFFGICAFDNSPVSSGAEAAYKNGWTTPEAAIKGGIKWIAENYIHSYINYSRPDQDTIYEMRWNVHNYSSPWHQYATDIVWSYKQVTNIKLIMDKHPNVKPQFEIPVYK
ncbi:N-acetylglucosaminidase [Clostridium sulfidigenes]|uniref:N-acetylglucosaminidase n=1 Tax=Clostridium sulfidigenes TaxID=318464 RepID=UPI003F88A2F6